MFIVALGVMLVTWLGLERVPARGSFGLVAAGDPWVRVVWSTWLGRGLRVINTWKRSQFFGRLRTVPSVGDR